MKTALLIVDMQNDIAHPDGRLFIPDAAHRAEIMGGVLDAFREAGQPVIHVVRSHRQDGWDAERFRLPVFQAGRGFAVEGSWGIQPLQRLEPRQGEPIVVKRRFSGFMGTELDLLLRRALIGRIVVVGVSLPNSPRATMFDAVSLDYDVIAIEEALASAGDETRAANFKDLAAIGIRIATADEIIREIMRAGDRAPTEGTTR
ncbi:MAG TPA: cysteine hydrolase [Actinomycetota bacterium]